MPTSKGLDVELEVLAATITSEESEADGALAMADDDRRSQNRSKMPTCTFCGCVCDDIELHVVTRTSRKPSEPACWAPPGS